MFEKLNPRYELFMLVLCVCVLIELVMESVFSFSDSTQAILDYVDNGICFIFIGDFFFNLARAKNKLDYLKWGWIDLLSSLPMFDILRPGRAFRAFRVLRLLRGVYPIKRLVTHVLKHKTEASFYATALVCTLLVMFASIGILQSETAAESNIKSPEDALWWAFVTITTVGYGDKFPVTAEGRIIASGLMLAGVGLFGSFTGYVASWFLSLEDKAQAIEQASELGLLRVELTEIKQLLKQKFNPEEH
jgi:voltage-gated potassium channel